MRGQNRASSLSIQSLTSKLLEEDQPEFLDKMKSSGLALTLREGEAKQVELSVISPTETAELLAKLGIE